MADEIVFEIIDERNGLSENRLILATGHQKRFGTEHFRDLGKHRGAPLGHKIV